MALEWLRDLLTEVGEDIRGGRVGAIVHPETEFCSIETLDKSAFGSERQFVSTAAPMTAEQNRARLLLLRQGEY